jgi:hypothetical protein
VARNSYPGHLPYEFRRCTLLRLLSIGHRDVRIENEQEKGQRKSRRHKALRPSNKSSYLLQVQARGTNPGWWQLFPFRIMEGVARHTLSGSSIHFNQRRGLE